MQALLQAITTLFETNATLQGLFPTYNNPPPNNTKVVSTNFWEASKVPENAPFPFCVATVVSDTQRAIYGSGTTPWGNYGPGDTVIRYTVYDNTAAGALNSALTRAKAMVGVFNSVLPTMTSGELINIVMQQKPLPAADGYDKNNNPVYRADTVWLYSTDDL
jgi:hypothetical protein